PAITAQLVCVGVPQTQHLNPVSEAWVTSDSVKLWTHRKVRNRTGVFLVSFLNPLHSLVDISQHGVIAGNCKCRAIFPLRALLKTFREPCPSHTLVPAMSVRPLQHHSDLGLVR